MNSKNNLDLYYDDPRLHMTLPGRFVVRFVNNVSFLLVWVLTIILLLSNDQRFFWIGVLFALYLAHKAYHFRKGKDNFARPLFTGRINLTKFITRQSFGIIEAAYDRSLLTKENLLLILLRKLLRREEVGEIMKRLEVQDTDFLSQAERLFEKTFDNDKDKNLSLISEIVTRGAFHSLSKKEHYIEPHDLFIGLVEVGGKQIEELLSLFSIQPNQIRQAAIFCETRQSLLYKFIKPREVGGLYPKRTRHRIMNRAWTAKPTKLLDRFSRDLTDVARVGGTGFLIGHEKEYGRLLDLLARPREPAALLLGEVGIGKGAIVKHLAFNIVKDGVPPILFDKRLVELKIGDLISGDGAEAQNRIQTITNEIVAAGNIILYIPDLDLAFRNSGDGRLSAGDILMPILREGLFPVIGAATVRAYKKYLDERGDLSDIFEAINVQEMSEEEAATLLSYFALWLEKEHEITITLQAISRAVEIAHKYFRAKPLPESALDLLRESLAGAERLKTKLLNSETILRIAEKKINIPMHQAGEDERKKLINLESIIREKYINQEEAVAAVSRALREYRSGLSRKGGPIASFLFVGPTGVGKTELSKILAEIQFGSRDMMVRFDMSEFQGKDSLSRFIGSPDGAITGSLTDAVLDKPYSLILLDEFEKTTKEILNLFLQVLDDGRLTDGVGRVCDFQNTIIIATSNAYSEFILKALEEGKDSAFLENDLKMHLVDYFKPELINRFSGIIIFKPLNRDQVKLVAKLQLDDLVRDILESQGIKLNITDATLTQITDLGFDRAYGARPLRRVIEEKLRGELANKILLREISKNDEVGIDFADGNFVFLKK
ncbi:MAG: ATP-dependent Clp protease ATP-binding subunit [Candidatus Liptonbacteria bacterium]|nr:ATP-dependent Clp protease ATP-binding subunit [Candidatus Liptonbacteria bacterium]